MAVLAAATQTQAVLTEDKFAGQAEETHKPVTVDSSNSRQQGQ